MKQVLLAFITLITICTFSCSSCKKEIVIDNGGLPPTTQTGANTLGFTLNGQPWTPKGQVGVSANLTVNVDFGYNKGIFVINAYRFNQTGEKEVFSVGVRDSLNFFQIPITIPLSRTSLYGITYRNNTCDYFNQDSNVLSSGSLIITKLDKTSQIIAGTFSAVLSKMGCDTIKIIDGRFDMKY